MHTETAFQQVLSELWDIGPRLLLKLPAHRELVHRQVQALAVSQERLRIHRQNIITLYQQTQHASSRQIYSNVVHLIDEMRHHADMLEQLAAEYTVDPEGVIECLKKIRKHRLSWPKQLAQMRFVKPQYSSAIKSL